MENKERGLELGCEILLAGGGAKGRVILVGAFPTVPLPQDSANTTTKSTTTGARQRSQRDAVHLLVAGERVVSPGRSPERIFPEDDPYLLGLRAPEARKLPQVYGRPCNPGAPQPQAGIPEGASKAEPPQSGQQKATA